RHGGREAGPRGRRAGRDDVLSARHHRDDYGSRSEGAVDRVHRPEQLEVQQPGERQGRAVEGKGRRQGHDHVDRGRSDVGRRQVDRPSGLMRWLPGLRTLRSYEASWLRHDIVAGLVLTMMLVPVGIAYAEASGIPGINGLYATIVPLLAYALFGPSRILVLGPDSSLAPIILSVVASLSAGDPQRAVALAGMMAVVSGVVCIAAGMARLGFVTELLSKPIRYGYMNGIALTVLISQLPKLFGFSTDAEGPLRQLWAIGEK